MTINALFAVDKFGGMGLNGTLPWPNNKVDLRRFKKLTDGHVVVMGRNTWDDEKMPKPIVGRTVYVATNRPVSNATPIKGNLKEVILELEKKHPNKTIWIVGGPLLLAQCEGIVDNLFITHMFDNYKSDVRIDMKQFLTGWSIRTADCDPEARCTFVKYAGLFKRSQ
jgi:dihydrofolate reductase